MSDVVRAETHEVARVEIDSQVATAKQYPRDIAKVRENLRSIVLSSVRVAEECSYSIPRDGKTIEGPSIRFAEALASVYGNLQFGARPVGEDNTHVTYQGVAWDLESNVRVTIEKKRSIRSKHGKKYSVDMIGVTSNACAAIAQRDALLKIIPKSVWGEIYDATRERVRGSSDDVPKRRKAAFAWWLARGVEESDILRS